MNERIKELMEKSGMISTENAIPGMAWTTNMSVKTAEKFAELIVKECVKIVDNAERGGSNEVWDNAVKFIRRDLKEHFGVEE
jgi:hypothetical protein